MNVRSQAESLYEAIRALLGQHRTDQVQQAIEGELSHMLPMWSPERPTCAGWYWYKSPGIGEPRLIHVDNGRIDTKLMADLGPPNNLVDVNRIPGQWAGPIEPPR
jgi:hypothetical protein